MEEKEIHYLHEEPCDTEKRLVYQKVTAEQLKKILGLGLRYLDIYFQGDKKEVESLRWWMSGEKKSHLLKFNVHNLNIELQSVLSLLDRTTKINATQMLDHRSYYNNLDLQYIGKYKYQYTVDSLLSLLSLEKQEILHSVVMTKESYGQYRDKYYSFTHDLVNRLDRGPLRFINEEE